MWAQNLRSAIVSEEGKSLRAGSGERTFEDAMLTIVCWWDYRHKGR